VHGGGAPQVQAKAQEFLQLKALHNARDNLQDLADNAASEDVRLKATNSALDRGGVTAKRGLEVEVGPKPKAPYEDLLENLAAQPLEQLTREQHRAIEAIKRGEAIPAALPQPQEPSYYDIVDAELVPEALGIGPDSPSPKRKSPPWADGPRPTVGIA
jgi:hypothetical protein